MLEIGSSYKKVIVADDKAVREIARISGDSNPIHLDEDYAQKSEFRKRIAHALFCINGISMIIGNYLPGNGAVLISQNFRYRKPVYIGDSIEITVEVAGILAGNKYLLRTLCKNESKDIVLDGESVVKWEEGSR